MQEKKGTAFKMTINSTSEKAPVSIKHVLKTNVNHGEISVGLITFKSCNGGVKIETNSKEEIEALGQEIRAKCGDELEVRVHTRRKPRLIIFNVTEGTSTKKF